MEWEPWKSWTTMKTREYNSWKYISIKEDDLVLKCVKLNMNLADSHTAKSWFEINEKDTKENSFNVLALRLWLYELN